MGFTGRKYQSLIANGLQGAQEIVCVSKATKEDVVRILNRAVDHVRIVFNGLNFPYSPLPQAIARQRISRLLSTSFPQRSREFAFPYLLHVGSNNWYKNRPGVIHIYSALNRQCRTLGIECPKLILSGTPVDAPMLQAIESYPECKDDIIVVASVASEDLCALYAAAELLLFPSYEEGFGWPIVEAQACGCRVVTTGKAPMNEVGGDAAVYLAPQDVGNFSASGNPDRAAATVLAVLQEPSAERAERVARGLANANRFSTSRMVREYLDVYRELSSPASLQVDSSRGPATSALE
jgi:glycosyltransferase involved in cell wall biosynthesis